MIGLCLILAALIRRPRRPFITSQAFFSVTKCYLFAYDMKQKNENWSKIVARRRKILKICSKTEKSANNL